MEKLKNQSSSKIGVSTFIIMSTVLGIFAVIAAFIVKVVLNHIANA